MTEVAQKLKQELSLLNAGDRAELAKFLIESLDESTDDEGDFDKDWEAELLRREAEIMAGHVGVSAETVFAELRKKFS